MPKSIVYSNPVKNTENLIVNVENMITGRTNIFQITDLSGRTVLKQSIDISNKEILIPASDLACGQYIYSIISDGTLTDSGKLIIK